MARTVFGGGQVFDGSGSAPAAGDVAVEDGRVVEVGPGLEGDERIDCSGRTVLPGLIDSHVHIMSSDLNLTNRFLTPFSYAFYQAARNLRRTLALGITTVRDAGGADLGVKQAVENGLVQGPRMQISVNIISTTGGHGDHWLPSGLSAPIFGAHPGRPETVVDGPDEMRKAARTLLRAGAEVLKVCTTGGVISPGDDPRHAQFTPEELAVLVTEARMQGRYVMAHAQGTDGIKNAVRAGVRSVEHGIYLDDEAIELMLEHGTWLVPTLLAPVSVLRAVEHGMALPEAVVRKTREVIEAHTESVSRAIEAGVRIAMGTDSGIGPHGTNLEELPLLAGAGLSVPGVLAATTSSAAELLGLGDELGRLAPGYRADLVLVDGTVTEPSDLAALASRVRGVWRDGVRVVDATGTVAPAAA
ncbi:amidohydrolase family protein [Streptomyces sp. DW26H14]|uniref:amidohydrolase family protein n=1 Tax=Streptomyces sp. DW26H14 TaxID=3435395 RepID=UPI00403D8F5B